MLASLCIVLVLIIMGEWFYAVPGTKEHTLTSTTSAENKNIT